MVAKSAASGAPAKDGGQEDGCQGGARRRRDADPRGDRPPPRKADPGLVDDLRVGSAVRSTMKSVKAARRPLHDVAAAKKAAPARGAPRAEGHPAKTTTKSSATKAPATATRLGSKATTASSLQEAPREGCRQVGTSEDPGHEDATKAPAKTATKTTEAPAKPAPDDVQDPAKTGPRPSERHREAEPRPKASGTKRRPPRPLPRHHEEDRPRHGEEGTTARRQRPAPTGRRRRPSPPAVAASNPNHQEGTCDHQVHRSAPRRQRGRPRRPRRRPPPRPPRSGLLPTCGSRTTNLPGAMPRSPRCARSSSTRSRAPIRGRGRRARLTTCCARRATGRVTPGRRRLQDRRAPHEISVAANARAGLLQAEHALEQLEAGTWGSARTAATRSANFDFRPVLVRPCACHARRSTLATDPGPRRVDAPPGASIRSSPDDQPAPRPSATRHPLGPRRGAPGPGRHSPQSGVVAPARRRGGDRLRHRPTKAIALGALADGQPAVHR